MKNFVKKRKIEKQKKVIYKKIKNEINKSKNKVFNRWKIIAGIEYLFI